MDNLTFEYICDQLSRSITDEIGLNENWKIKINYKIRDKFKSFLVKAKYCDICRTSEDQMNFKEQNYEYCPYCGSSL